MPVQNVFQTLNDALQEFKEFLDNLVTSGEFQALKTVLQTLQGFIPQITEMLNTVIGLLQDLRDEIAAIDIGALPNVDDAVAMVEKVEEVLEAARTFLPGQASTINDAIGIANVISGIPGLTTELKDNIIASINAIITHLQNLKP